MQKTYALAGIKMDIPSSEKIVFAGLNAEYKDEVITLNGDIVNLTNEPQNLRMLEASVIDAKDNVIEKWFITPPKKSLEAEQQTLFSSEHHMQSNHNEEHENSEDGTSEDSSKELDHSVKPQYIRLRFVFDKIE